MKKLSIHSIGHRNLSQGSSLDRVKPKTIKLAFVASPQAALRRKSKHWLVWNQNNVSEWKGMSTRGLLFQ
jgi:hypothetical protein